jgi:hypothetical protein
VILAACLVTLILSTVALLVARNEKQRACEARGQALAAVEQAEELLARSLAVGEFAVALAEHEDSPN